MFILPCILALTGIIYMDFFKVFFDYEEYYSDDLFVSLNREYVCLKTLENKAEILQPDSFIFGSSRSQAFKCEDWKNYLPDSSVTFHFDAANEALIGIVEKLEYLQKNEFQLKNVLLIFDIGLLTQTDFKTRNSSLTISHPAISDNSKLDFYSPFLSASINPKFVTSYFDYYFFRNHRSYMGQYIANTKYPNIVNSENMDVFYGKEKEIKEDSIRYYRKTIESGIFYDRKELKKDTSQISHKSILLLSRIKNILEEHTTDYRIVVSPMYDQIKLNSTYKETIDSLFKNNKVFDYSGVNEWTTPLGNFYEKSHYRPHVARAIMKEVYSY